MKIDRKEFYTIINALRHHADISSDGDVRAVLNMTMEEFKSFVVEFSERGETFFRE